MPLFFCFTTTKPYLIDRDIKIVLFLTISVVSQVNFYETEDSQERDMILSYVHISGSGVMVT